jgi:3-hydroxybutyryl-CoA dehydrogenase
MHILVIGNEVNRLEVAQKFGSEHTYHFTETLAGSKQMLEGAEIIFDFDSALRQDSIKIYDQVSVPVFLDTTFTSLSVVVEAVGLKKVIFGFCGLQTFVNRELLEVSISNQSDEVALNEWCVALNTKYSLVKDQVGFIIPRVICMIINEAYFTVAEGTATRQDIDLAMKLGTNYPFGPFEWAEKIGIRNVYDLLTAVHKHTSDERYLICPLLKQEV